jgi:hypothetical protein
MAGGVFFFGFFLLDKQKKEPRQSGETDSYGITIHPHVKMEVQYHLQKTSLALEEKLLDL